MVDLVDLEDFALTRAGHLFSFFSPFVPFLGVLVVDGQLTTTINGKKSSSWAYKNEVFLYNSEEKT
jgi:cytochrome b subunit of formate dehydrogenase